MRITKKQLKQIIREEVRGKLLREQMEANILDYLEMLEKVGVDGSTGTGILTARDEVKKLAAAYGFKWNETTYLDALDAYFDRMG